MVGDYLVASGGIVPDTGDPHGIWFVDKLGRRTRAELSSTVVPGSVILVDQNSWTKTQKTFTNITIVTTFVASVLGFLTTVLSFVRVVIVAAQ